MSVFSDVEMLCNMHIYLYFRKDYLYFYNLIDKFSSSFFFSLLILYLRSDEDCEYYYVESNAS